MQVWVLGVVTGTHASAGAGMHAYPEAGAGMQVRAGAEVVQVQVPDWVPTHQNVWVQLWMQVQVLE